MIYLYLSNYAEQNPSLAVMAINTFLKDCKHPSDPRIRGLALRNLCSLRFSGSFEYLMPAILEALKDHDAYVRKTAVMGCIKVHFLNPEALRSKRKVFFY
jgi:AP-4 complex subunit beta-1